MENNLLFTILRISNLAIHFIVLTCAILLCIGFYFILLRKLKKRYSSSSFINTIEERNLIEQLFNSVPDNIFFKDLDSKFILANKQVAAVMGEKNPKNLIGKTDFDYYDKELAQIFYDDEQKAMRDFTPLVGKEETGFDLNGNKITVSTSKIPIKGKNNKVIGVIGIGRDISKQKKNEEILKTQAAGLNETNVLLEERQEEIQQMAEELNSQAENLRDANKELEKLSLVASQTDNIVIIMDGNGKFVWVNKAFEKKYGLALESYLEKYGNNLRDSSSNENISAILNQVHITKKPFSYNSKTNSNGKEIWNQTNITPICNADGEITHLILIDSDITELKYAEQKINTQKTELEKQAEQLSYMNATKDRLFSIIAHDLKNPFHSILGFTEILQKQYSDIDREKLKNYLEMISSSSKSAFELLENLLDWARAQTDNVKFEPSMLNIKDVVRDVISLQSLLASNKNIKFSNEIADDINIYADRNMINTVIRNITGNSIKYTNPGGFITFGAYSGKKEIIVEIADTGIGIPEDRIDKLFQLERVSSTAGTAGETGTGLGLIVCSEFMKKNGGKIEVKSIAGKGSTFKLIFPKETK